MSRTVKIVLGVLALVIVLAVIAVFTLFSQLESIIRAAVEKVGSDVTGTEVTLGDVDISLQEGKGVFSGFRMTNPQGFRRNDAFRFDQISLTLDTDTVFPVLKDPVIIKEIIIDGPKITYELTKGGSNFDKIQNNVDGYNADGQEQEQEKQESEGDTPNFIIQNLYFRNGDVAVSASEYFDQKLSAPLPDIHLQNIGSQSGGATPEEIVKATMDGLYGGITEAVQSVNLDGLVKGAEEALEDAGKAIEGAAEDAGAVADDIATEAEKAATDAEKAASEAAEDAGKAIEGATEDAEKAIKGLFQ